VLFIFIQTKRTAATAVLFGEGIRFFFGV